MTNLQQAYTAALFNKATEPETSSSVAAGHTKPQLEPEASHQGGLLEWFGSNTQRTSPLPSNASEGCFPHLSFYKTQLLPQLGAKIKGSASQPEIGIYIGSSDSFSKWQLLSFLLPWYK